MFRQAWASRRPVGSICTDRTGFEMLKTDRQTYRQTGRQTDRQTERQTERQTDRHTDKQRDRQTVRYVGRQTDRQIYYILDFYAHYLLDRNGQGRINFTGSIFFSAKISDGKKLI